MTDEKRQEIDRNFDLLINKIWWNGVHTFKGFEDRRNLKEAIDAYVKEESERVAKEYRVKMAEIIEDMAENSGWDDYDLKLKYSEKYDINLVYEGLKSQEGEKDEQ